MARGTWKLERGEGPVVAVAVHHGHDLRPEVAERMALDDDARLREEDPFTGEWAATAPTRIVAHRSRFEVDLNRAREIAVYRKPEDAWGLDIWGSRELPEDVALRSLEIHDAFYQDLGEVLHDVARRHGRFVLFDLHSYNHMRSGPDGPPADPDGNPQVNLGTRTMDREFWAPVVERFMADLRSFDYPGGKLDVRENVKFPGREVPRFVHTTFPRVGCALAVEVKKFFMDEWTGVRDETLFFAMRDALQSTIPGLLEELMRL